MRSLWVIVVFMVISIAFFLVKQKVFKCCKLTTIYYNGSENET